MARIRKTAEQILAEDQARSAKARERAHVAALDGAYKEGNVSQPQLFKQRLNAYKKLRGAYSALIALGEHEGLSKALDEKSSALCRLLSGMVNSGCDEGVASAHSE